MIKKIILISSIILLGVGVYEASSIFKPGSNRNTTMEDTNRNTTFIDRNTTAQNV
ncbi:RapH phosphatase inhibitor [Bacillus pumilus]|nr:RapH phosphatase inhibitor [Bacillus pumilus]OLP64866.1 hypothetical protein BACPU_21870 [Bacillus pumilus]